MELMIVIAIIAVIAAIALPSILHAKMNATEAAAIGAMKSIASAETIFRQKEMPAPVTAAVLGTAATGTYCFLDDLTAASLIDSTFTPVAPGLLPNYQKMGYQFFVGPSVTAPDSLFGITSFPSVFNATGQRCFVMDGSGTLWYGYGDGITTGIDQDWWSTGTCTVYAYGAPPPAVAPVGK